MSHEVFTEPWARAWSDELRQDDGYRDRADADYVIRTDAGAAGQAPR